MRKIRSEACGRPKSPLLRRMLTACAAATALIVPATIASAQTRMQTGDGLLQVQAQLPDEVRTGEQFQYKIMLRNSSDNVVLHDIVLKQTKSDGFSIESTSQRKKAEQENSNSENEDSNRKQESKNESVSMTSGQFKIDKLEPGQSKTITVKAAADKEGELRSCLQIESYKPALCMTSTVVKPDLQITKNAPEQADRCNAIELVYTVNNDGSGDVGTFQIVDELGDGLKTIEGNSTLKFDVDGLRSGDTRQFVARVFATRPGSFTSRAVAKAEDSDLRARSASTTTNVESADLQVKIDDPGRLYGQDVATFTAYVTNTGNITANDVAVNVMWPGDASLVDISDYEITRNQSKQSDSSGNQYPSPMQVSEKNQSDSNQNSDQESDDHSQQGSSGRQSNQSQGNRSQMSSEQFMISDLQPGETATFQYAVRPRGMNEVETQVKALYVCAVDMAQGQDQAVSRITSTGYGQATIVRLPAMQMFIVDDEDPVTDGTAVTYTIRVTNEGDAAEQNIQLTATLPQGLEFKSADGPTEFDQNGSEISFQQIDTMEPGDTVDFEVTASNKGQGSVNFKATLSSQSLDKDVTAEEPTQLVSN